MALKEFLILSRPRSGRVEGRTALIQFDYSRESGGPGASDGTSTLDLGWRGNDDISD